MHPAPPAPRHLAGDGTPAGAAPQGVCTAHASPGDPVVTAAEPEFARQFGLSAAEIRGHRLLDLLQSRVPNRLREQFTALSEGRRRRFTERVTGRNGNGRVFSAEVTGTAVRSPSGEIVGLAVVFRPVADARRPEGAGGAGESTGPVLSALDAQVLEGVAGGESTVQLASRLYLSRQGIEYRVGQMLRRFDAPNRPALVARAHALGMFAAGQWPPRVLPERVR
ncbi:PAS domain-containing protein [Streptomyces griseomycini]|uniref:PAS domain-containing protein n=1 Tax=Streptomyces griseomycini TaxID=66895 RepID=UPI001E546AA9|nr:PAS domain-containing protein [Streptomyces griseomycini]